MVGRTEYPRNGYDETQKTRRERRRNGPECRPDRITWCDGSEEEYHLMLRIMIHVSTAIPLNSLKRPDIILVRSDPADVARVEDRTHVCFRQWKDAGPALFESSRRVFSG